MKDIFKLLSNVKEKELKEEIIFSNKNELDICDAKFSNQILDNKEYENIEFRNAIFNNCKISSKFNKFYFTSVVFDNCDLSNTTFYECNFHNVIFINCKLVGTIFDNVVISDSKIESSNLSYTNFYKVNMRNVIIYESEFYDSTFNESKFTKLSQDRNVYKKVQFIETLLSGIDFSTSSIEGLTVGMKEIKGGIFNEFQAVELAKLLGIVIK